MKHFEDPYGMMDGATALDAAEGRHGSRAAGAALAATIGFLGTGAGLLLSGSGPLPAILAAWTVASGSFLAIALVAGRHDRS